MSQEEVPSIFKASLYVPKNDAGMNHLNYGLDDSENILEWHLTPEENVSLGSLYLDINDLLGTLLDFCEEDTIAASDVPSVLDLLMSWNQKERSGIQLSACAKLKASLLRAIEYGTFVELWL